MILVIEQATDLQPIPQEPQHCSLEQALRNMDWPFPVQAAAMATPRPALRAPTRLALRSAPAPVVAPVRQAAPAPLPMLAFAAAL
jgi:hypothetical protein